MPEPAEKVVAKHHRAIPEGMREVRLTIPDSRDPAVRARIAEQAKSLDAEDEAEAMRWIEAVTRLDETR